MTTAIPRITLEQIQNAATQKSFDRGEEYYSNGAISNAIRQEFRLWADCYGSEAYETAVTLNQSGIHTSSCTCPYDWSGLCKHQIALLLTYLHNPDRVQVIAPLAELLKPKSREDLVKLIEKMLDQSPNLLSLIETSSPTKTGEPLNLTNYERQIKRAFHSQDIRTIENSLNKIVMTADNLLTSGNWQDAGRLYQMLLEESIESYDELAQHMDYDGDVICITQDIALALSTCLGMAVDADESIRELWLSTLLDGKFQDIEFGGLEFAEGAWRGILDYANREDWEWIEFKIRHKIQPHISKWQREALVRLLVEKSTTLEDTESSQNIIEELGSPEQKVFLWASEGKWDAAIALAKQEFTGLPGLVFQLADRLLVADLPEKALSYMLGEIDNGMMSWKTAEWLENYYIQMGDLVKVIEWSMKGFEQSPTLSGYNKIQELHPKKREWKVIQEKLFEWLESNKRSDVLIDIMLLEGKIDRAIELLVNIPLYRQDEQQLKVAKVAETEKPKVAIEIYKICVTKLINGKNRSAYQRAIEYLKTIRSLYESLNQNANWNLYITTLRKTYPTLRALQEELTKAKL